MNFKPTRHRFDCKSSLLDMFLANIPLKCSNVRNMCNLISDHDGVSMFIHFKDFTPKVKSYIQRNYNRFMYSNIEKFLLSSKDLKEVFRKNDSNEIRNHLLDRLNKITVALVSKRKVQIKKKNPVSCQEAYYLKTQHDIAISSAINVAPPDRKNMFRGARNLANMYTKQCKKISKRTNVPAQLKETNVDSYK